MGSDTPPAETPHTQYAAPESGRVARPRSPAGMGLHRAGPAGVRRVGHQHLVHQDLERGDTPAVRCVRAQRGGGGHLAGDHGRPRHDDHPPRPTVLVRRHVRRLLRGELPVVLRGHGLHDRVAHGPVPLHPTSVDRAHGALPAAGRSPDPAQVGRPGRRLHGARPRVQRPIRRRCRGHARRRRPDGARRRLPVGREHHVLPAHARQVHLHGLERASLPAALLGADTPGRRVAARPAPRGAGHRRGRRLARSTRPWWGLSPATSCGTGCSPSTRSARSPRSPCSPRCSACSPPGSSWGRVSRRCWS